MVDLRTLAMRAEPPDQVIDVDLHPAGDAGRAARPARADPGLRAGRRSGRRPAPAVVDDAVRAAQHRPLRRRRPRERARHGPRRRSRRPRSPSPRCASRSMPDGNLLGLLAFVLRGRHAARPGRRRLRRRAPGRRRERRPRSRPVRGQDAARCRRGSRPSAPRTTTPRSTRIDATLEDGQRRCTLPLGRCADNPAPLPARPGHQAAAHAGRVGRRARGLRRADPRRPVRDLHREPDLPVDRQRRRVLARLDRRAARPDRQPARRCSPTSSRRRAGDLDGPTDVSLWIIQRDERLGVQWYESCIRVAP